MISISEIIWGELDENALEKVASGEGEVQAMSYNCIEMCCTYNPPPPDIGVPSFIGCK